LVPIKFRWRPMSGFEPEGGAAQRIDLAREPGFTMGTMQVRPASAEVIIAGERRALQPRVMQVLVALSRRNGDVVSRDELVEMCWEGLSVSEDAISRCIAQLRRLAEQGGAFAIETVPRLGYRLDITQAAPVTPEPSAAPSAPRAAAMTIAVLPFVNMSSDPEQEFFSDGITEDIITDLARWPTFSVSSRYSTARFKGQPIDPEQIKRELAVRFFVEGSVRKMADRIRITAQLIDAESGHHVWAERY